MSKQSIALFLIFLVSCAFTCHVKVRELKPTEVASSKTNNLQVEGWALGDEKLLFDFAFSSKDSLKREIIKSPVLSKIQLLIDTSLFKEDESLYMEGRRRIFTKKVKNSNNELIVLSIPSNYTFKQIKKNGYPILLTVETNTESKSYTLTFK